MAIRLENLTEIEPKDSWENYWAQICNGAALWADKYLEQSRLVFEQAVTLKPDKSDAYFWKGIDCASLGRDEEAMAAIEKALELELPPVLLTPLRWFEQDRPDFYEKYIVPLMVRYDLDISFVS